MMPSTLSDIDVSTIARRRTVARGSVRPLSLTRVVLQNYQHCSWTVRCKLRWRWWTIPYEAIAAQLPSKGLILDLGCGYGLMALTLGLQASDREVIGIDHNAQLIAAAQSAAQGILNVHFKRSDWAGLFHGLRSPATGIAAVGSLNPLTSHCQPKLLERMWSALAPGGILVVWGTDNSAARFPRIREKNVALMKRHDSSDGRKPSCRRLDEWRYNLERVGFEVEIEAGRGLLPGRRFFICHKI